jgi:ribosomal protein S6
MKDNQPGVPPCVHKAVEEAQKIIQTRVRYPLNLVDSHSWGLGKLFYAINKRAKTCTLVNPGILLRDSEAEELHKCWTLAFTSLGYQVRERGESGNEVKLAPTNAYPWVPPHHRKEVEQARDIIEKSEPMQRGSLYAGLATLIYAIDKEAKTFTLENPEVLSDADASECHMYWTWAFTYWGYKVTEQGASVQ